MRVKLWQLWPLHSFTLYFAECAWKGWDKINTVLKKIGISVIIPYNNLIHKTQLQDPLDIFSEFGILINVEKTQIVEQYREFFTLYSLNGIKKGNTLNNIFNIWIIKSIISYFILSHKRIIILLYIWSIIINLRIYFYVMLNNARTIIKHKATR